MPQERGAGQYPAAPAASRGAGGLDSPIGAVVGGLLLGVLLSYVTGYISPEIVTLAALAVLMVVLLVKPGGLFSSAHARRV